MDIQKIIEDLREQCSLLDEAILVMEKIARTQSPRRGRPPKWLGTKDGHQTNAASNAAGGKD